MLMLMFFVRTKFFFFLLPMPLSATVAPTPHHPELLLNSYWFHQSVHNGLLLIPFPTISNLTVKLLPL